MQNVIVVVFDKDGKVLSIEEKPNLPRGNHVVVGSIFLSQFGGRDSKKLHPVNVRGIGNNFDKSRILKKRSIKS